MLPYTGPVKAGEVWKTESRKGTLTIRVLEDIDDQHKDGFFDAEIIEGKAHFISQSFNDAQRFEGYGVTGSVISFRTTLTNFLEKVGFMPIAADEAIQPDRDPRLPA